MIAEGRGFDYWVDDGGKRLPSSDQIAPLVERLLALYCKTVVRKNVLVHHVEKQFNVIVGSKLSQLAQIIQTDNRI